MPGYLLSTGVTPTQKDFHQYIAKLQRWKTDYDSQQKAAMCNTAGFPRKDMKATAKHDGLSNYISK